MSEVKVNKVSPRSGTNVQLGDSGDTITIPSGATLDASSGGLAGTLTTAAQPNITSVGTLTSFTSTGIDDNATSTAITIDSGGKVGIGTTSPAEELHISRSSDVRIALENTSNRRYDIISGNSGEFRIFDTAVGERMRIDSSGDVGIGTSSPSNKLDVVSGALTNSFDSSFYGLKIVNSTTNPARINLENSQGTAVIDANNNLLRFRGSGGADDMVIDSSGNVGIGTSSPGVKLEIRGADGDANAQTIRLMENATMGGFIKYDGDVNELQLGGYNTGENTGIRIARNDATTYFNTNGSERMRIDSSGNVGIGTSSPIDKLDIFGTADNTRHITFRVNGNTVDASTFIRGTKNNSEGAINSQDTLFLRSRHNIHLSPSAGASLVHIDGTTLPNQDNTFDFGSNGLRWDNIYATNGSIQTSDQNQKQSIQFLTTAEMNVAKRLSSLIKTFKWNSAVEEKGDSARTHTGIIAQDVQQAFNDEGLDANNYALFCSDTWWEKEYTIETTEDQETQTRMDIKQEATDGYTERTKLGVRYPELLSFIQAYNDQRFTELEARITQLENA